MGRIRRPSDRLVPLHVDLCRPPAHQPFAVPDRPGGLQHGDHWGRALTKLGDRVKLMPPAYVKPDVKRGKTDAADAEAIAEAVNPQGFRHRSAKKRAGAGLHVLAGTVGSFRRQDSDRPRLMQPIATKPAMPASLSHANPT